MLVIVIVQIGKAKPTQYISFPPSHYGVNHYDVIHNISNCTSNTVQMGNTRDEDVIICPYDELLLDGITQTNMEDDVTNNDIQTFYTWNRGSIPDNKAFVTLQFPNNKTTPTRVAVYCLMLNDRHITNPRQIRLYSSNTSSEFPNERIRSVGDINDNFVVIKSGRTFHNDKYEYRRYDLIIPEHKRVPLNYLRISLTIRKSSWIFISEVEVYHLIEQCK